MEASTNEEMVEPPWENSLIEQNLEENPNDKYPSVQQDSLEVEDSTGEGDGAQLEGAVEKQERAKAKNPPGLLANAVISSHSKCALYLCPHEHGEGSKGEEDLEG